MIARMIVRKTPGLISIVPGALRPDSPTEFCMVMVWKDLDLLKAFVGDDYQSAHVHPDEAELVRTRTISHYDLVAI